MKDSQHERVFRGNHPQRLAIATGLILVGSLLLVPSSTSFAQSAVSVPNAAPAVAPSTPWRVTGNNGTNPSKNFLGTTDNTALVLRTDNVEALRILPGGWITGGNVGISTTSTA